MFDFRDLVQRALGQLEQRRFAEAEQTLRTLLASNARDDQLLHLLGVALIEQGRDDEAIEPLKRAISLSRREAEYHNALGCALRNIGQTGAGIESLQRAIRLDPRLHDAQYNLALSYQQIGDFARAQAQLERLNAANPRDIEIVNALASLHWLIGDHEGALQRTLRGIEQVPESGWLRFVLGERLLALGRFEEGWFQYLWRGNRYSFLERFNIAFNDEAMLAPFAASLAGQSIHLHAEQGIGDDLFFLRFAPELRARGARLRGEVTPRLLGMIGRSGVLDECAPALERIPSQAGARMMGDLPYLLQAYRRPVPPAVRFEPLPEKRAEIAARVDALARPLIGLTWRAGTGPEGDNPYALYKKVPFELFVAMARRLPGTLVLLQREPRSTEMQRLAEACGNRVVDLCALNGDLEGMLALLERLDDYVGVSNTNMHLCAALGRTASVLVSRLVEFRWMAEGAESPWFPGFRVYRPALGGEWAEALDQVTVDVARDHRELK